MNLLILEDNKEDLSYLLSLIHSWELSTGNKINIQTEEYINCTSYALRGLLDIDAAILDIEAPGIDGISFAKHLRKCNSRIDIAFISSHVEYLTAGFNVYACTFIEKPAKKEQIEQLLDFLWKRASYSIGKETVAIKRGANIDKYYATDILYVKAAFHGIEVVTCNGKVRYNMTLDEIFKLLPQKMFFRCQKSVIVNIQKIKGLNCEKKCEIILVTEEKIHVSSKNIALLKARIISDE